MKESSQIRLSITIPKGYIVTYRGPGKNANLKAIMKMVKKAEKNNVLLSKELIENLSTMEANDVKEIKEQFDMIYTSMKGQIFRSVFASGEDIEDEEFTFEDFLEQISHYFVSYGLGEVDYNVFEIDEKRKVQVSNISKRKDKQDINNTFKIIETKSVDGFNKDVKTIIESPIVFGSQQIEFIKEANRLGFLGSILNSIKDFKIKENMFQIIDITGKEFVKTVNVLKTATDILRYCYWTSGLDFTNLEKGIRFNLKTTDKKIVMMNLNLLANKNMANLYGDMKPYKSQWLSVSKNLFPGSKKFKKYSSAQGIFDYIRNGGNIATFNSITQQLIKDKDYIKLAEHLSHKPGELLRSLDMIIRNMDKGSGDKLAIIINNTEFNPKLIIQVRKWLGFRINNGFENRTFNVKGKPVTLEDKPLKPLKKKRTKKVIKALRDKLIKALEGKELFVFKEIKETNKEEA
jgi:hypothetical protein